MKTFEKRRDGIKEWESAGGYGMMGEVGDFECLENEI